MLRSSDSLAIRMNFDEDRILSLLRAVAGGQADALDELMPLVYAELRRIASRQLRRLGGTPTMSTTVLVHEVYERLVGHGRMNIDDERHFFAICARVMHQVVVDHAREHAAVKRGRGRVAVTLEEVVLVADDEVELSARLAEALEQLSMRDAGLAELARLAWFAGLDTEHIARLTRSHVRQVQRDLKRARAWIVAAIEP